MLGDSAVCSFIYSAWCQIVELGQSLDSLHQGWAVRYVLVWDRDLAIPILKYMDQIYDLHHSPQSDDPPGDLKNSIINSIHSSRCLPWSWLSDLYIYIIMYIYIIWYIYIYITYVYINMISSGFSHILAKISPFQWKLGGASGLAGDSATKPRGVSLPLDVRFGARRRSKLQNNLQMMMVGDSWCK